MNLAFDTIDSSIGTILLVADDVALCALDYGEYEERMHALLARRFGAYVLRKTTDPFGISTAMQRYFAGAIDAVDTVPVSLGGTPFQQRVWAALRNIPAGSTTTYGALAAHLQSPGAARAVGLANSLNPIAIVVPCHRVVGANADLTGYAGGLHRKRWLLRHESRAQTLPF